MRRICGAVHNRRLLKSLNYSKTLELLKKYDVKKTGQVPRVLMSFGAKKVSRDKNGISRRAQQSLTL